MQPGQLITPQDTPGSSLPPVGGAQPEPERPAEQPAPVAPAPTPPAEPVLPPVPLSPAVTDTAAVPTPPPTQAIQVPSVAAPTVDTVPPEAQWLVTSDDEPTAQASALPPQLQEDVSWNAAEFTDHQKTAQWYVVVMLSGVILAALDYIFVKDLISTCFIILATFGGIIYSSHKPRTESYHLTPRGIQIGGKLYGFQQFKNFSVSMDGAAANIIFTPLGRVSLPITVSVPQDVEEKVFSYLSACLPFESHRNDAVDGLLRKMKF